MILATLMDTARDTLTEYKWALPAIGPSFLCFKKVRVFACKMGGKIYRMFTVIPRILVGVNALLEDSSAVKAGLKSVTEEVLSLKKIVGFNGGGGMMDAVGYLLGYQSNAFWHTSHPGFVCSSTGVNLECTQGYLFLLGLKSREELKSMNWENYVEPNELKNYFDRFVAAASRRDNFRFPVGFLDIGGVSVGRWLVVANPLSAEAASTVRYIGFFYPLCPAAQAVAIENSWPLHPPT